MRCGRIHDSDIRWQCHTQDVVKFVKGLIDHADRASDDRLIKNSEILDSWENRILANHRRDGQWGAWNRPLVNTLDA